MIIRLAPFKLAKTKFCSLAQVSATSFVLAFWPMIASLIPEAVLHPYQCEEIFTLANTLFKRLAETSLDILNLENLVKQWGALLLSHSCREVSDLN
jgi:ubiquitin carboxyl-terminal hydrolase 34